MKAGYTCALCCDGGRRRARQSELAKDEGSYFKSHDLQSLAIETAEGCAEWLDRRIREVGAFLIRRKLLKPEEIRVQLTEGFMMEPEASVSALVFQHPDCTYFSVGDAGEN
jgi:5-methyltetrahydrofolate--homocysteine methyltransferase